MTDPALEELPERPITVQEANQILDELGADRGGSAGGPRIVIALWLEIDGESRVYGFDPGAGAWRVRA